jgi:hypothetical protein
MPLEVSCVFSNFIIIVPFFFLVVLGFELRASRFLGSALPFMPWAIFCSGYFGDKVSLFIQACIDHDPPILSFLLSLE